MLDLHADPVERELPLASRQPSRCVIWHIRVRNRRILWRTNTNHVLARTPCCYPAPEAHPLRSVYPRFYPSSPVSPIGCSDLHATSYTRVGWKATKGGSVLGERSDFAQILWVVRPCLWLALEIDEQLLLALVSCFLAPRSVLLPQPWKKKKCTTPALTRLLPPRC